MPYRDEERRARPRATTIADIGSLLDKMFFILGCDPHDQKSMLAARERFQYLEEWKNRESWFKRTTTGLVVAVVFAFVMNKLGLTNIKMPPL